jgi:tetratricopeptide (TPR) repeat protein
MYGWMTFNKDIDIVFCYIINMIRIIRISIYLLLSIGFLSAQEIRINPENFWNETQSWDQTFSSAMLIESSLSASGLTGEKYNEYVQRYKQILEKFKIEVLPTLENLSEYEKGEIILTWSHTNILTQYIEEQTLMDVLIDTGKYNCVSSAIFYLILSKEAGLTVDMIETSDHAFCSVITKEGRIDVETTTAFGFNPGLKKEFQQSFNQTGYTYVPPGNYRSREQINDREAVALILQNRMSFLQKYNKHKEAIGIAIDRWILAGNPKSRTDMNDAFRNWSAVLNNRGDYKEAYLFTIEVSDIYDLISQNNDLLFDLAYNHIISLTNENNYSEANNFLIETKSFINNSDQKKLENLVFRDYLADIVRNKNYHESLPLVRNAYIENSISKSDWENWLSVLHQNEALIIAETQGWWNSWQFLKLLPSEEKNLNSIKKSIIRAHDNWSFEIHNKFADLFNSQQFKKAEELLLEALSRDPDNKYLKKDLTDLKKINP